MHKHKFLESLFAKKNPFLCYCFNICLYLTINQTTSSENVRNLVKMEKLTNKFSILYLQLSKIKVYS